MFVFNLDSFRIETFLKRTIITPSNSSREEWNIHKIIEPVSGERNPQRSDIEQDSKDE